MTVDDIEQERRNLDSRERGQMEEEDGSEDALTQLERQTHEFRVSSNANGGLSQSTIKSYGAHVALYESHFLNHFDGRIPPYPILPAKVAHFLQTKMSSVKRGGGKHSAFTLSQVSQKLFSHPLCLLKKKKIHLRLVIGSLRARKRSWQHRIPLPFD